PSQHVAEKWLVQPGCPNRPARVRDERLENLEPGPSGRANAARGNSADDRRDGSRTERCDFLETASVLVADWETIEKILDGDEPDAFKVRGATRPHAFEILQRRGQHVFVHRAELLDDDGAARFHLDFPNARW